MHGDAAAEQYEKDQPTILPPSVEAERMREEIRRRRQAALQKAYEQGWRDGRYWPHDEQPRRYVAGVRVSAQPPEKGEN